ncbi:MAG: Uncharacterised protein [Alphaproteobacteria bacterium UBA4588]|jgi:hypothetical protein|nr:hypothetical protein [Alphaproteobacteria bacterium]CAI8266421.1 MAG: Uncharacterised protein [Alphaproteobacteria bacterium UBA4588]
MEFLLLWVLSGNIMDSGLRYKEAGECYATAQNLGKELRYVGLSPPQFTCIPVKKGAELRFYRGQSESRFPF